MTPEGYPDDAELDRIAKWPYADGWHELMAEVKRLAWERHGSWTEEFRVDVNINLIRYYRLTTGGWSGNEDLIGALRQNFVFWAMCWVKSARGGLYVFEIPVKEASE